MIVPNIESGNLLGKAFTYYLKLTVAHVVMGARLPVLIPSRNESDTDKFHSLALGVLSAASLSRCGFAARPPPAGCWHPCWPRRPSPRGTAACADGRR